MTAESVAPSDVSVEEKHPAWTAVMARTHARWQKADGETPAGNLSHLPYDEFLAALDERDAQAVALGKLNYQVQNGGFVQWFDNGYYAGIDTTLTALEAVDAPAAREVLFMVEQADETIDLWDGAHDELKRACRQSSFRWLPDIEQDLGLFMSDQMSEELHKLDERFYRLNEAFEDEVEAWVAGWQAAPAVVDGP